MSSSATSEPTGRRVVSQIASLDSLVGAHPSALRKIYGAGKAADPKALGEAPRGLFLALEPGTEVFLAMRPLIRAIATGPMPWQGKTFDHGGNSGQNVVLGTKCFRFRAEVEASALDARPSLVLRYDAPAHENPWPLKHVVDELRAVGPGIAIGPALVPLGGSLRVALWFGLASLQAPGSTANPA